MSPVHANLSGLPPLLLQVGELDLTRDSARELAARGRAAGVDATLDEWPEMIHMWQGLPKHVPETRAALDGVGDYLRKRIP